MGEMSRTGLYRQGVVSKPTPEGWASILIKRRSAQRGHLHKELLSLQQTRLLIDLTLDDELHDLVRSPR